MAQQAAAVEISRSRGGATLHQAVCVRLDVDPDTDDLIWDSYRNPEGRWVVTAYHAGSAVGTWLYEDLGRSVHPQDEAARALMGGGPSVVAEPEIAPEPEQPRQPEPTPPAPTDTEVEPARPRLVSVTSDPLAQQSRETGQTHIEPTEERLFDEPGEPDEAATPPKRNANSARGERAKRTKGKRGRASVPSWDEILFGATKSED